MAYARVDTNFYRIRSAESGGRVDLVQDAVRAQLDGRNAHLGRRAIGKD
jgi:hypothetical protein